MPSDPNNPEVLASVRTDVEAAAIVGALAARGIGRLLRAVTRLVSAPKLQGVSMLSSSTRT